ncbi:MAG: signal peptidase I [Ruminococcaceae bacterium]|jgi:signal peptidase I|nr:signal peptidase I [Oscillospiraceae bacterium]
MDQENKFTQENPIPVDVPSPAPPETPDTAPAETIPAPPAPPDGEGSLSLEQLEAELKREKKKKNFASAIRNTIFTLITVAAIAVLVAVLLLPVLQIYGSSMTPTLEEGNIVVSVRGSEFKTGEVVAFYYNNNILVKRVIAHAGDWVDIDDSGTVYVNSVALDEPYITDKAFGECNIELPYQVPESRIFVMGDHRDVSIDSRNTAVGCVADEQIVGKIIFRVWPLADFGIVK